MLQGLTDHAKERFPPRKQVRMVKIHELFTVFMWR